MDIQYKKENKLMTNSGPDGRSRDSLVCVNIGTTTTGILNDNVDNISTCKKRRRRCRFRPSYIINTLIGVGVLFVIVAIETGRIPYSKQGFFCNDPSISFKYKGDTISNSCLGIIITAYPLVYIWMVEILRSGSVVNRSLLVSFAKCYGNYVTGVLGTLFLVEISKLVAAEHRPHFLDTCAPDKSMGCLNGTWIEDYQCTNTEYKKRFIIDSSLSFPSGHAAIAMYTGLFCAFYIQVRLHSRSFGYLVKPFFILIAILAGPVVGLTRITDHRHHWWDVLFGLLYGTASAFYSCIVLCNSFKVKGSGNNNDKTVKTPRSSASTAMLLDVKNKDATSVLI